MGQPDDTSEDRETLSTELTVETVRTALRGVVDPELGADIVELGMVDDIVIDGATVTVTVALTTSGCPLRHQIRTEVQRRVGAFASGRDVVVRYGEMNAAQKRLTMERARLNARERAQPTAVPPTARVLAIGSGKGGVGKSSVTVNLAVALAARGFTVGVLDADISGFSIPAMLNLSERLGGHDGKIDPHEIPVPSPGGRDGRLEVVSMGSLVEDDTTALMWRGLVLARAVEQFLTDVRWDAIEYLLIDLPPGTSDIPMALTRLLPQAELLVVTTPNRSAQHVAARLGDLARRSFMPVLGVIENMTELVTPAGERVAVFGSGGGAALAESLGVPLVAQLPLEPAVGVGADAGQPLTLTDPHGPVGAAFGALAALLADKLAPPVDASGCTARLFAALDALDLPG